MEAAVIFSEAGGTHRLPTPLPRHPLGSGISFPLLPKVHLAAESLLRRPFPATATPFSVPQADPGVRNPVVTSLVVEIQMDLKGLLGWMVQLPLLTWGQCPVGRKERRQACIAVVFKSCPRHLSFCEF